MEPRRGIGGLDKEGGRGRGRGREGRGALAIQWAATVVAFCA